MMANGLQQKSFDVLAFDSVWNANKLYFLQPAQRVIQTVP